MDSLGLALIVGGAAFVVSGLVFLPGSRKRRKQQETIDESREQIEFHLRAMRRNRDDLS